MSHKAVALISGGLDSMLAAKLILDQGIHVEGLNFYTGFCHSGHTSAIKANKKNRVKRNDSLWVAEQLGIKLHIIDIVEPYKDIVINPKHGYGKNLNPCLDCKVFMVSNAIAWAEQHGFDFVITGEVVGQRPKSQLKVHLPIWDRPFPAKLSLPGPQKIQSVLPHHFCSDQPGFDFQILHHQLFFQAHQNPIFVLNLLFR